MAAKRQNNQTDAKRLEKVSIAIRPPIVLFQSVYAYVVVFRYTPLGGQRSCRQAARLCIFLLPPAL